MQSSVVQSNEDDLAYLLNEATAAVNAILPAAVFVFVIIMIAFFSGMAVGRADGNVAYVQRADYLDTVRVQHENDMLSQAISYLQRENVVYREGIVDLHAQLNNISVIFNPEHDADAAQ